MSRQPRLDTRSPQVPHQPNQHAAPSIAPAQTTVVYDSYDLTRPPRHPGRGWTRFVCVSDTHGLCFPVPPGDVLLHAGDLTGHGTLRDLEITLDWMKGLPHYAKYFMAGNHDVCLDVNYMNGGMLRKHRSSRINDQDIVDARDLVRSPSLSERRMHYLEHETAVYTSRTGRLYTIYGSPAARLHKSRGAFQYISGQGKAIYERIPAYIDILMTHTPPAGLCDTTKRGQQGGCDDLARRLEHRDLGQCRLHVYGHIHEAHGVTVVGKTQRNPSGRVSANAALPNFPLPIIVDLLD